MFDNYAISSSSDYVVAIPPVNNEFPKLNGLCIRPVAKTRRLHGWYSTLVLALASCLSVVTSGCGPGVNGSDPGALRVSPAVGAGNAGVRQLAVNSSVATYPATDTFSGSGALSAEWTNTTAAGQGYVSLVQSSGTVIPSVPGQQGLATYTGITFTTDQYAQAKFVTHPSASGSTGVCVRMNTAGNGVCYLADYGLLYSLANGAGISIIASSCPVAASGDTIQLLVVGTAYTCTDVTNGRSVSATDSTYSTGSPGILVDQRNSTAYALANFQADCVPSCNVNTTYPAMDTFSGSGALSGDWTNTTAARQGYVSLVQSSGTVVPSVPGQQGLATYTGISFTNDQYAQAKFVTHPSAPGSTGVCVRMNTAGNGVCYLADYGLLYSLANGAGLSIIASSCPVAASGDTIQLLVVGTAYTCTDVTTGRSVSATDSTYSTGNPGILVDQRNSTAYALANFQADCVPSCNANSTYPAMDTFSGSGALSGDWTNTTAAGQGYVSLVQSSGTVVPSVPGQQGLATYTGITFTNNQYAQARFMAHSSPPGSTGVCVRMNTAGSGVCYLADFGLMYSLTNGAGNYVMASACPVAASGDTIQLLVVGTNYTCTDVTTGGSASITDSLYSTGNPGILVDQRTSTVSALANFQADCVPSCGGGSSSVATPVFSPVAGTYSSPQTITISSTTPSATIYYTTDGTTPTTSSAVYSGPLAVNSTETIKAIGTVTGYASSAVGSAAYTIAAATANPQLIVSTASLSFGSVTVNTAATQSVTLSSTGTSPVAVSAAAITGAGFTIVGGSLPVTLNPTQSVTLQVQFLPISAGAVVGQLTINSNSVTGSSAVVALSGTGTAAAAHEVSLNWDAPISSPDPVAGYNIYRSTGSGSFQLTNSSPDAQTTYVDSTVVSGASYNYIVKSVDYNGVESIQSNQITVTIP